MRLERGVDLGIDSQCIKRDRTAKRAAFYRILFCHYDGIAIRKAQIGERKPMVIRKRHGVQWLQIKCGERAKKALRIADPGYRDNAHPLQ